MPKGKFSFHWPFVGNTQITEFLEKSIINNKVAGTYIFNGPDNFGKTTTARYFAQCLLCQNRQTGSGDLPCGKCSSCHYFQIGRNKQDGEVGQEEINIAHGDFHIIKREKDKKNISVEQVREFIRILSMSSFLSFYKVGIIKHADSLSLEAANALLKTLEEPKDMVVIILITQDIDKLPTTIVSRSQILNFRPVKADIIYEYLIKERKVARSIAKNLSRLCLGRPALAVKFLENKNFAQQYQKQVKVFLNFLGQDINERFFAIDKLISPQAVNQEPVRMVKRVLEVWQGIIRDWLLLEFGHNNLIQHQSVEEEINKLKDKFTLSDLLNIAETIRQAEDYLDANVSPKLVLENMAIAID